MCLADTDELDNSAVAADSSSYKFSANKKPRKSNRTYSKRKSFQLQEEEDGDEVSSSTSNGNGDEDTIVTTAASPRDTQNEQMNIEEMNDESGTFYNMEHSLDTSTSIPTIIDVSIRKSAKFFTIKYYYQMCSYSKLHTG